MNPDANDFVRKNGKDKFRELVDQVSPDDMPAAEAQPRRAPPSGWWRDATTIPKRQTLYDGHYSRKTIGATIGAGGRAKTTGGIYEAVSMACGFDISTRAPLQAGCLRVWLINGEEDQDELDRRAAATCQRYHIKRTDLGGRLYLLSVRDKPLRIATLTNNRPVINADVVKYIEDFIIKARIDVFMVDPLVSFHSVAEIDNGHMDLVIKEGFGGIANRTNSAGEVFHHPGKAKPGQIDTAVEDGRGASAILWAVRSARVFNFMSPDEAKQFGLSEDERRLHIRISNGKANMGPVGKAKWIKLEVEPLANGDAVACASPWSPPDPFKNVTATDMELARKLARTGAYRADMRSPDWFGYALADHFGTKLSRNGDNDLQEVARIKAIIKTWLKNKVLAIEERQGEDRKPHDFIVPGPFKPDPPTASTEADIDEV